MISIIGRVCCSFPGLMGKVIAEIAKVVPSGDFNVSGIEPLTITFWNDDGDVIKEDNIWAFTIYIYDKGLYWKDVERILTMLERKDLVYSFLIEDHCPNYIVQQN